MISIYTVFVWIMADLCTGGCFIMENSSNYSCGISVIAAHTKRIVGGSPATPGSWPWMVMLGYNGNQECGGSILNENVVLTSAHCFDGKLDTSGWTAYIGKYHMNLLDPVESSHRIQHIIVHPSYLHNNDTLKNDLALLVLQDPAKYSDYVRPICLPPTSSRVVPPWTVCYAIGWGDTKRTGDRSMLNQVGLPLMNDFWCGRPDWYGSRFIRGYTFCAGYQSGGKDACAGDSGGPYMCQHNNKWYVQGVTSWGYDCAQPKWPGIYADVSKYRTWIRNTMNATGFPLNY